MKKLLTLLIAVTMIFVSVVPVYALQVGDYSYDVYYMQVALVENGYLEGEPDGSYGPKTETAVKAFQTENGLSVTGIADDEMLTLLYGTNAITEDQMKELVDLGLLEEGKNDPVSLELAIWTFKTELGIPNETSVDEVLVLLDIVSEAIAVEEPEETKETVVLADIPVTLSEEDKYFVPINTVFKDSFDEAVKVMQTIATTELEETAEETFPVISKSEDGTWIAEKVTEENLLKSRKAFCAIRYSYVHNKLETNTNVTEPVTVPQTQYIPEQPVVVPIEPETGEIVNDTPEPQPVEEATQPETTVAESVVVPETQPYVPEVQTEDPTQPHYEPVEPEVPAPTESEYRTETPQPTQPTEPQTEAPTPAPTQPQTEPQTETPAPVHQHTWTPVYKTVHHDAVTHTVHHDATYKTVHHDAVYETRTIEEPVYDEAPVYATRYYQYCSDCGREWLITDSGTGYYNATAYDEIDAHNFNWDTGEMLCWGSSIGRYEDYILRYETQQTGTASHQEQVEVSPAYDEQVVDTPAWDETVTDSNAYDEQVIDYYVCNECGAIQ